MMNIASVGYVYAVTDVNMDDVYISDCNYGTSSESIVHLSVLSPIFVSSSADKEMWNTLYKIPNPNVEIVP